jgi:hypothetical protein
MEMSAAMDEPLVRDLPFAKSHWTYSSDRPFIRRVLNLWAGE